MKSKILAVVALIGLAVGCGQNDNQTSSTNRAVKQAHHAGNHHRGPNHLHPARPKPKPPMSELKMRYLNRAVKRLQLQVGNLQSRPGYQTWTATKIASELLKMQSPEPPIRAVENGRSLPEAPRIDYTIGEVTQPWQVVLAPNDAQGVLIIKAYGVGTQKPAIIKRVKIATY